VLRGVGAIAAGVAVVQHAAESGGAAAAVALEQQAAGDVREVMRARPSGIPACQHVDLFAAIMGMPPNQPHRHITMTLSSSDRWRSSLTSLNGERFPALSYHALVRTKSSKPGAPARDDLAQRARDLLTPYLRRQAFRSGDLLWREGEDAGMFVVLDSGRVKIYRVLPNGNAVTLYIFGPGDAFGFMPFFDGRPYPASAQALTDVEALVMPRSDLVVAFERDPGVALALVRLLATRLREAFDRIERSSLPEVLPRVAAAFSSLLPTEAPRGLAVVELPVSAGELAGALGVAPESFSRAVTKLVEAGALHRLGPRRFQVLDGAALRRAARRAGT
jgi:CRP/FNR family transcriptional regulator